jgi:hypothetical protein
MSGFARTSTLATTDQTFFFSSSSAAAAAAAAGVPAALTADAQTSRRLRL